MPARTPLPPAPEASRTRLELLLVMLTGAMAPVLLVTWLLLPSRDPQLALASQLIIPIYAALALGAWRLRPSLLARGSFAFLLFALQTVLIIVQVWAYDRPGSPLWLAFLPGLLVGAARWQLPGTGVALGWFYIDRLLTLSGSPGLDGHGLAQELTLELAVMTVMGVLFAFLFRELELYRQRLRASSASLPAVLENVGEAILTVDARGVIAAANLAAGDLFGGDSSSLLDRPIDQLLPSYRVDLIDLVRGDRRALSREARGLRHDGSGFTAEVVTSLMVDGAGPIRILVLRDITELQAQTAALSHQALHDSLTGLPNRLQFTQALRRRLALARRQGTPLSLLIMDLDNFKEVNDIQGHLVGDQVLQAAGQRLRDQLRAGDLVARLGGDEFAILPAPSSAPGSAMTIAEKIVRAFAAPFALDEAVVETGISLGVATFPDHGEDAEALMRHADAAMYAAKRQGGGWASAVAAIQSAESLTDPGALSAADLRRAIENGELELHCAPVMGLDGNALHGVDAQVRWRHPDLDTLEPEQFIPLAERNGLIRPLIRTAVRMAVEQMAQWREAGSEVGVSVELSERNFRDGQLAAVIAGLLRAHNLSSSRLTLLIDHASALAPTAPEFFAAGSRLGLRLAIDDYGLGSASLRRLRSLPISEIRLAASVTAGLGGAPNEETIVQATVQIAHALGITVVAKGVGDQATLELLRRCRCDGVTFRAWTEPLPAHAINSTLNRRALQMVLTGSPQIGASSADRTLSAP